LLFFRPAPGIALAPERWHNPFARLRDDNIANQQTSKRATNIKNAQIKGKSGSCDVRV